MNGLRNPMQRACWMAPPLFLLACCCEPAWPRRLQFAMAPSQGEDVTANLQSFLDSESDTLVISPTAKGSWETGPLWLRRSRRVVLLTPGTVLRAAKESFPGKNDCLFTLENVDDITVIGYGAKLVMRKKEYRKGEWRHAINIRGSRSIRIRGLTIDSSGGDGVYVDGARDLGRIASENIDIRDCWIRGHRRQGISVISVRGLLIENCRIRGTSGTPPEAGLDLEPDHADQFLERIQVRNCAFTNNRQHAAMVYLGKLRSNSRPVSIGFKDCLFEKADLGKGFGIWGFPTKDGVAGIISFQRCEFRGRVGPVFSSHDKSSEDAGVVVEECGFSLDRMNQAPTPGTSVISIWREIPGDNLGGFTFRSCRINARKHPPFSIQAGKGGIVRSIGISAFYTDSISQERPPGVTLTRLERKPFWSPPPPMLQSFLAVDGSCSIALGNWAKDSLSYRVSLGSWISDAWGAKIRFNAGDTVRAFSHSAGLFSDTLVWVAPACL